MHDKPEYNDYPITLIAESMQKQIARGATTYQKWTCAGCGERIVANEPNTVYKTAQHDGRVFHDIDGTSTETPGCGAVTDIEAQGCNFLFILPTGRS